MAWILALPWTRYFNLGPLSPLLGALNEIEAQSIVSLVGGRVIIIKTIIDSYY